MELALELREAVISAVCAKNVDLLPGLIQKLAKLSPTEDVLRGSGVGHLVGDRHIWGLAGYTTQKRGLWTVRYFCVISQKTQAWKVHNLLGKFLLAGIPPAPQCCIEVTLDFDAFGVLKCRNSACTSQAAGLVG